MSREISSQIWTQGENHSFQKNSLEENNQKQKLLSNLVEPFFTISSVSQGCMNPPDSGETGGQDVEENFWEDTSDSRCSLDSEENILMTCLKQGKEDRIDASHNQVTTSSGMDIVVVLSNMPITLCQKGGNWKQKNVFTYGLEFVAAQNATELLLELRYTR